MNHRRVYLGIGSFLLFIFLAVYFSFKPIDKSNDDTIAFSKESGFYSEKFYLELSATENKIYYTLDGTEPNEDSPEYKGPIEIGDASVKDNRYSAIVGISSTSMYVPKEKVDKCTVVKAISIDRAGNASPVSSKVYFVGYDEKAEYENLKILSIVADPYDLFSGKKGIYVLGNSFSLSTILYTRLNHGNFPQLYSANYMKRGKDWERDAYITLFDQNKEELYESKLGIRVHGGWSRSNSQKSFNFYERNKMPEACELYNYVLRTGGIKDTYSTMIRDSILQELSKERNVLYQAAEPCVLFLNGEYWGIYNLEERYLPAYFKEKCGIEEKNLLAIKNREFDVGNEQYFHLYEELESFLYHTDFSKEENYRKLCEIVDVDSLIDYYIIETYFGNSDWPHNNVYCYRSIEKTDEQYGDGRWRWALMDLDDTAALYEDNFVDKDPFDFAAENFNPKGETLHHLMYQLSKNETFCESFMKNYREITEQDFQYSRVHSILYERAALYAEQFVKTQHRYCTEEFTIEDYWENIRTMDNFLKERTSYMNQFVANAFEKEGTGGGDGF